MTRLAVDAYELGPVRENKGHMFSNIGVTFINVQEATSIVFLPLRLIKTNIHSSEIV